MGFAIHVAPETLEKGPTPPITGVIMIEVDSFIFPSKQWSDFPVTILAWWASALRNLRAGRKGEETCDFMDGPFQFDLCVLNDDIWTVRLIKRTVAGSSCLLEVTVSSDEVTRELLSACRLILASCQTRGWHSDDIENLRRCMRELASCATDLG